MTNYEKRREEIEPLTRMGIRIAIEKETNEIRACNGLACSDCLFRPYDNCAKRAIEWADSEYIEPQVDWSKVAVDTPILVKRFEHNDWSRRYFSHYENENGFVCAFSDGKTSWTADNDDWKDWNYAKLAEEKE